MSDLFLIVAVIAAFGVPMLYFIAQLILEFVDKNNENQ